jgi:D,D-heptose 1,7-bisphosphate phosphatase
MRVRQAVVLVGGKGTRLGELTQATPKPLLELAPGERFLDALLFEISRSGLTDILLLAGHLGQQIEEAYSGRRFGEAVVRVIREPHPQGTGGALRFAADSLDPWFLMTNGDSLFEINFRDLVRLPDPSCMGRLALREVPDPARYGAVSLQGDLIVGFHEKNPDLRGPALINGGIYLLSRNVLSEISGPCSIEADVFPRLAARGQLRGQAFAGYFLDIGLPDTYEQARREIPQRKRRPCAFLDRDGVLNKDDGYTYRPADLIWLPGAREAVKLLNEAGYYVVVVTNQAGIARGYYTEEDMHNFHQTMADQLADIGAHIDAFYFCPFHKDAQVDRYRVANHPDRKPNPGMIRKAMADWPIKPEGSFLIGDSQSDIDAAIATGLEHTRYEGGDVSVLVRQMIHRPSPRTQ